MSKKISETDVSPIDIDADLMFNEWEPSQQVATSLLHAPTLNTLAYKEVESFDVDYYYCMIFALKGHAKLISMKGDESGEVHEKEIMLIPMGKYIKLESADKNGFEYISIQFRPSINLCMGKCPRSGTIYGNTVCKVSRNKSEDQITTLNINEGVWPWIEQVLFYIKTSPDAIPAFEVKLRELFYILRIGYDSDKSQEFLSSYHCHNLGFRAFVFRHHLDCKTVEDLAELMQLSTSTVKRLFLDEFGMPPLKWMHEQKARFIYRDLADDTLSLQQIADRYHFSSISYLCVFCRKAFGVTPLKARKILTPEWEDKL